MSETQACAALIDDPLMGSRQCGRWAGHGLTGRFCWQHDPWRGAPSIDGLRRIAQRDPGRLIELIEEMRWAEEWRLVSEMGEAT